MREFSGPATTRVGDEENLLDAVFTNAEQHGDDVVCRRKAGSGWVDVTAARFAEEISGVARGLIADGVAAGDRVALLARTRYEWTIADYAALAVGAVVVPIYETSAPDQVEWILTDSAATAVVVESARHRVVVDGLRERLPSLRHVYQIEPSDGADSGADPSADSGADSGAVAELTARGADVTDETLHARRRGVRADDLATLIYTSGTTGRPKGCQLTHRNLLTEVQVAREVFPQLLNNDSSILLFMPLAHVFGKAMQCCATATRTVMAHTPDVANLVADLGSFRPRFLVGAPRVFEKVYNGARQRAHDGGKGRIFEAAAETAVAWSRAQDSGGPGLGLRVRHALFDRLVYGKLRAAVGGQVSAAISGSAPLGEFLGHFFRGVGILVLEGYGLTETSAGIVVNTEARQRMGTVGQAMPGHAVRIADDGEIELSGPLVFTGYWRDADATAAVLTDGWFATGDLGHLDDDGFLTITGRKKEIIVTAGGKNVAPAALEDRIRAHALVSQIMVVGDRKPFIGAIVTIDPDAVAGWLERAGRPRDTPVADLVDDTELRSAVQAVITEANQAVSRAEQIREFRILPVDFSEAGGEMTPTFKVRRAVVARTHADAIEDIYRSDRRSTAPA